MTQANTPHKFPLTMLLLAGLLVGTLDITTACVDYYIASGKGPEGVLRYVASGVFGKEAFTGSDAMQLWGLLFHFIIAYSFTFFFYWLYTQFSFIRNYPVIVAILYGIFMWTITTRIVLPLSNTPPPKPFNPGKAAKAAAILIIMISTPLTLIMRSYWKRSHSSGH